MSNSSPVVIPSQLDTSFSGDGKLETDFNSTEDNARAVTVMSNGNIVVAGTSGDDVAVARN